MYSEALFPPELYSNGLNVMIRQRQCPLEHEVVGLPDFPSVYLGPCTPSSYSMRRKNSVWRLASGDNHDTGARVHVIYTYQPSATIHWRWNYIPDVSVLTVVHLFHFLYVLTRVATWAYPFYRNAPVPRLRLYNLFSPALRRTLFFLHTSFLSLNTT